MMPEDAELAEYYIDEIHGTIDDDDFQFEFFSSLADQFTKKGHLSEKQLASLKRIYQRVTGG